MKRQATAQSQLTLNPDWLVHYNWQQRVRLKRQGAWTSFLYFSIF